MAINTQTIRIDLNTGRTIPVAFAHQNDTNRQLTFQLYNNGVAFTPSSTTVKFAYKSPIVNGRYSVITGSQMASGTVSGNTVTVTLPSTYTAVSGVGLLTMILTTSGNTLRPVNIKFVCQSSADGDDQILNASDWPEGLYDYMDDWLAENEPTEIANLKSDLSDVENRLIPIDGIITLPTFEKGSVYANNGVLQYSNHAKRIRMPQGTSLHLEIGDIIHIDSGYKVGVNYSADGGATYTWQGFVNNNWSVSNTGEYALFIEQSTDITDVKETESHVSIESVDNLSANFGNIQSNVNDLMEVELTLFDGYYSTSGGVVEDTSEDATKYTQKIKCFEGMKLHVSLSYLTSAHASWIATCEWKKDGTFVRSNIVSGNIVNYTFDYVPTVDVDEVSITFRSFNDCEFTVQSLAGIFTVYEVLSSSTNENQPPVNYAFSEHLVKGINHRGYNRVAPENTMPAFKLSVEHDFSFVETDIRFTSDNIPVLLHDATVDRTSSGTGNIADMTFAQARELDFGLWKSETYAGTKIPSFEEFILFCRNTQIFPYIEISGTYTATQFDILVEIVKNHGMLNAVTWISFSTNNLKNIALRDATARLGQICGNPTETLATAVEELRTGANEVFIDADYSQLTNDGVTVCKNHGFQLETWTINTAEWIAGLPSYVSGGTSDIVNFETVVREQAMS